MYFFLFPLFHFNLFLLYFFIDGINKTEESILDYSRRRKGKYWDWNSEKFPSLQFSSTENHIFSWFCDLGNFGTTLNIRTEIKS